MDTISSSLLAKLQNSMQTIDNNANPQMEVITQKAAKYINQGTFLAPRTIRTGDSLGRLDITIRREDKDEEPTEIVMIYIEDGLAKVATMPYVNTPDDLFEYQYTIGPATDVACDFDGRFAHITDHTELYFDTSLVWALVTFGEPYLAVVNDGTLTLYHGLDEPIVLVESGVTRVSLLRGWKSVTSVLSDQGLICAYVKTDGKVYYQNYCEMEDGSYVWDIEREVTVLAPPITDISLFRTADYRIGFIVEGGGTITWAITYRSWSGMAIPPEYLSVDMSTSISISEITYYDGYNRENITTICGMDLDVLYGLPPIIKSVANIDDGTGNYGVQMLIKWDENVFDEISNITSFKITDAYGGAWPSTNITKVNDKELIVTFVDFNNCYELATLTYTPGTLIGDVELVELQTMDFMPVGLIPTVIVPPALVSYTNVEYSGEVIL